MDLNTIPLSYFKLKSLPAGLNNKTKKKGIRLGRGFPNFFLLLSISSPKAMSVPEK
jgi:hypothetical protein